METIKGRNDAVTIGKYLEYLLPRLSSATKIPVWPPDVFAVCSSLLVKSGAYCKALANWPPQEYGSDQDQWAKTASELGSNWRSAWVNGRGVPRAVAQLWRKLLDSQQEQLQSISQNLRLCQVVLQLCAIADEASHGVGSPLTGDEDEVDQKFQYHADELLERDMPGSTICEEIHASRVRVLPKMHTPQTGLTVRSLSLYLALCAPSEVIPRWFQSVSPLENEILNLLIVPWPFEVHPAQFRKAEALQGEMRNMPQEFGFFTFDHRSTGDVVHVVEALYDTAVSQVGRIDGVVLPELALSRKEQTDLKASILKRNSFLVSGFGAGSNGGTTQGENMVGLDFPPVEETLSQRKHHRWKLDSSQISQYRLGGRLYPEKQWWEHICLEERDFFFASIHANIVLSVLICEDLARPDPVADLVRAVGPNLVIALLMDGPQLKYRWASRFAATLADDPGCSVLCVTSLGMSTLSRPRDGESRSRVVALWKDAKSGGPVEIALDEGAGGIVLSLSTRYLEEWSADGRSDDTNAAYPILSGIHCVSAPLMPNANEPVGAL